MNMRYTHLLLCLLGWLAFHLSPAQVGKKTTKEAGATVQNEQQVREIINFLQYLMNTIGSDGTPARDKDVMITESFSKIFFDTDVQIEDDLDIQRSVITNKDVISYLKDVDFFFKDVKFQFDIEEIKSSTKPDGGLYYKVTTRRILTGTTTDGKSIQNTMPRYIEINFDDTNQDLKIASIYTHEFDRTEALMSWWDELSFQWKFVLKKKLSHQPDSMQAIDIEEITAITELDLSHNTFIRDLEPLAQLYELNSLNLSGTAITDLTPIRNLAQLRSLNIAHTRVTDLSPLRYAHKLEYLNVNNTPVRDLTTLGHIPGLKKLYAANTSAIQVEPITSLNQLEELQLSGTLLADLTPFSNLLHLKKLDIARTRVTNLQPVANLKDLTHLDIDSTYIENLDPLAHLENLIVLEANYTSISDLSPLVHLQHLEKVYADFTSISKESVRQFNTANPKVRIIFNSEDLKAWWTSLSMQWKKVLSNAAGVASTPSKEEMAKIAVLDSVSLSNNRQINDLEPLRHLQHLEVLMANGTGIRSLTPLEEHSRLRHLDVSNTEVQDLSVLRQFHRLEILKADNSKIENLEQYTLPRIQAVYADGTYLHDIIAREFLDKNPQCLLMYKTNHLRRWWNSLSESWKNVFTVQLKVDSTRESLHRLAELEQLQVVNTPVSDLSALNEFVRLRELHLSGAAVTSLPKLDNLQTLHVLRLSNNPLDDMASVQQLSLLEELDISNTPLRDLDALSGLTNLRIVNCAGTQVRRLDPLENLSSLEQLDCSNTNIRSLSALEGLSIRKLICYNTRLSSRTIERFKETHPECEVVYY